MTGENLYKHGLRYHRLYKIWSRIKEKCYNKNYIEYHLYGGRGIKVCDEWKNDFIAFYNWSMGNGYSDNLTIDRYPNNDGDYEPSNCRWATLTEQANNRRGNIYVEIGGERVTLADACRMAGVGHKYKVVHQRIKRDKLSFNDAIIF